MVSGVHDACCIILKSKEIVFSDGVFGVVEVLASKRATSKDLSPSDIVNTILEAPSRILILLPKYLPK